MPSRRRLSYIILALATGVLLFAAGLAEGWREADVFMRDVARALGGKVQ